jgi:hypothetical protein
MIGHQSALLLSQMLPLLYTFSFLSAAFVQIQWTIPHLVLDRDRIAAAVRGLTPQMQGL